jgi:hypothetical protein
MMPESALRVCVVARTWNEGCKTSNLAVSGILLHSVVVLSKEELTPAEMCSTFKNSVVILTCKNYLSGDAGVHVGPDRLQFACDALLPNAKPIDFP